MRNTHCISSSVEIPKTFMCSGTTILIFSMKLATEVTTKNDNSVFAVMLISFDMQFRNADHGLRLGQGCILLYKKSDKGHLIKTLVQKVQASCKSDVILKFVQYCSAHLPPH